MRRTDAEASAAAPKAAVVGAAEPEAEERGAHSWEHEGTLDASSATDSDHISDDDKHISATLSAAASAATQSVPTQ